MVFARLLQRFDLPRGVFQCAMQIDGRPVRVDRAWPPSRVVAEVDGLGAHRTAGRLQRDLARQNRLVAAGMTVLWFTRPDVARRPEVVATTLAGVLAPEGIPGRSCENRAS